MEKHPYIKEIVYVAPQKDWSFPLHSHESSAELSLVINGKGSFYALNRHRTVSKGMLVVKNPGLSHSEKSDPDDPLEQICIEVGGISVEGRAEGHVLPQHMDPVLVLGEEFDILRAGFIFLKGHFNDEEYKNQCRIILDLTFEFIEHKIQTDFRLGEKIRSKKELVTQTLAYLDSHYREKIKIRDLAELFFTSEGNLSRQFKAVTGYTINEYILSKRMGEAQRLLIYEDCDIKEAAKRAGYDDIQYFYHVFRSFANCTPAEFREKYRH